MSIRDCHGRCARLPLLLVALSSCTAQQDSTKASGNLPSEVSELAAALPGLTLEEVARIDGHDAELVPVTFLTASTAGRLAVLQRQDHNVRLYDPDGRAAGTFGRAGSGPGEFKFLVRGGWVSDTLWVSDNDLKRITLVPPGTGPGRTIATPPAARPVGADVGRLPVFPFVNPQAVYPGDTLLVFAQWGMGDPLGEAFADLALLRVTHDGAIERVVLRMPGDENSVRFTTATGITSFTIPFSSNALWAIAPGGATVTLVRTQVSGKAGGTIEIRSVDAHGRERFTRQWNFNGVSVPASAADSAVALLVSRHPALSGQIEREVRGRIPAVLPPVSGLLIGADGRTWLGLRRAAGGNPWIVLDSTGQPEGSVHLPPGQTLRAAAAQQVWAIEQDELGVESIVMYRLNRARGSN